MSLRVIADSTRPSPFESRVLAMTETIRVRRAVPSDTDRILKISSTIWEGDDYVPETLDGWLDDPAGELVVAMLGRHVIAFAHRSWLCPGIAWFEGIRTDPEFQGRGAGRAITEHLIDGARKDAAARINLSTYIDNEASIHLITSYGFRQVGTFCVLERPADTQAGSVPPSESGAIRRLPEDETIRFVETSEFLALAGRRFPRGWRFFPFDQDPHEATARLAYRIGYDSEGALVAVLCVRQGLDHEGAITMNFLDGTPEGIRRLLHHALVRYRGRPMECMLPADRERHAAAFSALVDAGFSPWNESQPDVFVYELWL